MYSGANQQKIQFLVPPNYGLGYSMERSYFWIFNACLNKGFSMKKHVLFLTAIAFLGACSSNPHKAKKIETKLDQSQKVYGGEKLGLKDGEMVLQKKVLMAEEIRELQVDVHELEDRVYGNQKYGSWGLYGVLKDCRKQLADKSNGGDGKLKWIEKVDRVTDQEDEFKIGIDERDKLVAVKKEYLIDRINRYKKYKKTLKAREVSFQEKVDICKTNLKSQKYDHQKGNY